MQILTICLLLLVFALPGCKTAISPEWSPRIQEACEKGQLTIGMTRDQVRSSWGYPQNRHVFTTNSVSYETWVYHPTRRSTWLVMFDPRGRVSSVSQ